jgi:phospholipase C
MSTVPSPLCESLESRTLFAASASPPSATLPRPDHIVVVVEENKSYTEILGVQQHAVGQMIFTTSFDLENQDPSLRLLARHGANVIHMQAETHPSQPNYLALFSGATQHVNGDDVPKQQFTAPSLGGQLLAAGLTFAGYSEDLPSAGSLTVKSGEYARKHNPWSDFVDVPASDNLRFADFPNDYTKLPTVSFVVPNQLNDMHSGLVRTGDRWLRDHIRSYARWAPKHNSLLVVTWDEGHGSGNQIATIITGAGVKRGMKKQFVNHYSLLRTIEDMYGLPHLGNSAAAQPMTSAFGLRIS